MTPRKAVQTLPHLSTDTHTATALSRLFVSSSLRLSFSRYSQAFFVGIFTVLQLISVFFSYIVIYNRIKAALLLSNRTHEAALWAVFRSPMRWVDGWLIK